MSKQQQAASLQTVLRITHQGLLSWHDQQINTLTALINNPIYLPLANQLRLLPKDASLISVSPAHTTLHMQVMPMLREMNFSGYELVDANGIVISSNDEARVTQASGLLEQGPLFRRLMQGNTVISEPLPAPNRPSHTNIIVAAPLFDNADNVIAALLIEQDAEISLGKILKRGRQGESGEAYAFTREGLMLTSSRFEPQLRSLGLLEADQRANLNLMLTDPGYRLTPQQKARNNASQPLTSMVKQAVKYGSGFDVDGYRDYRGELVTGAWLWDDELGFGIAVEMDVNEAYAQSRQGVISSIGWTVLLAIGTLTFAIVMVRFRRRMQKQDHLLTELINRAPVQLSIKDLDGRYLMVNDALASRFAVDKKSLVGAKVEDYMPHPEARSIRMHDTEVLETAEVKLFEETFDMGGQREVLRTVRFPLFDLDGKVEALCAVAVDVTEQVMLREELHQLNEELERRVAERSLEAIQANQAKSEFVANMSHEIRTPMNAVLGMVQLLYNTPLTSQQKDYVDKAQLSAKALLQIINDILDFSKIEAGKLALEKIEFQLDKILDQAISLTAHRLVGKEVELMLDVDEVVPKYLLGDPLRLTQVLTNLLSNATKFTTQGEITLRVRGVQVGKHNANLVFEVHDTGIGIESERLETLFSPFEQADGSTTREFGGTGLGLSICKRLVELMGGQITVTSEVGEGTCFRFTLSMPTAEQSSVTKASSALKGKLALVVDDSAGARGIYANMLQSFGMEVFEARDGEAALTEVVRRAQSGTPYQLLLVDWKMPRMDGLQLLDQLLAMQKDNPVFAMPQVLMMTAFGYEDEFARQVHPLSSKTLYKPFTPSALFDQLCDMFDLKPVQDAGKSMQMIDLTQRRILLVEDNPINQQVASELLASRGADVDVASNGRQAIAMTQNGDYELILMDIQMPEMDGLEATQNLRELGSELPIIAMTAHAMNEDKEKSLAAGMNDHINKPIDPELMFSVIKRWLPEQRQPSGEQESLFDSTFALGQCSGNETLLGNALRSFVGEAAKSMEAIAGFHKAKELELLAQTLHKLRGSASNLGMVKLVEGTRLGESLCSEGKPSHEYEGWVTDFRLLFQQTIQSVKKYLEQHQDSSIRVVPVPRDTLLDRLEGLRTRIQQGEYIDDQEIARLKASFRAGEDSALFERLSRSLFSLDQEAALGYLEQLLELLRARYR
ncbi:response regulator [Corallincola platygyrae]|uniref:histidine kinase n=1 Tax=Corallincola platygyrae TaxID=1193278 RepID=A0ABW4XMS1_9GAMM